MNRTEALKTAQKSIGKVQRVGKFDYTFTTPWDFNNLSGATTTRNGNSFTQTRRYRKINVVLLAMHLMELPQSKIDSAEYELYCLLSEGTASELLKKFTELS